MQNLKRLLVAFDFDDTISSDPIRFNSMAWAFVNSGHQVVILTAGAGELPIEQRRDCMIERARNYGFDAPHELFWCDSLSKGEWCQKNSVDVMVDDREDVLKKVKELSPKTICLQVKNDR